MQRKYLLAPGAHRPGLRQVGPDGRPVDARSRARKSEFRIAALLCASNWPVALSCTVHDYSDTGARLQLDDLKSAHKIIVHIPNRVRLYFLPWEQEVDCRIVWRDGSHFGVEYLGCMHLAKPRLA
jgi:hypothetical protein